jgi:hypothetical protein
MDWTLIGLGVAWGVVAPMNIFLSVMATDAPRERDPIDRLLVPLLGVNLWLPVAACVAGIAFGVGWLAPHGLWRGETFLVAPLVSFAVIAVVAAGSPLGRVGAAAVAALLIWLAFQPLFYQVLLWLVLAVVGLSFAASIIGSVIALLKAAARKLERVPLAPARAAVPQAVATHAETRHPGKHRPPRVPVDPGVVSFRLLLNGVQVATFQSAEGLPPEADPNHLHDADVTDTTLIPGVLTLRAGSTRDPAFLRWCAQREAADCDVGIEVLRHDGNKFTAITLRACRAARFSASGEVRGETGIDSLVLAHNGWRHRWS